jgi:hypothetical protein
VVQRGARIPAFVQAQKSAAPDIVRTMAIDGKITYKEAFQATVTSHKKEPRQGG